MIRALYRSGLALGLLLTPSMAPLSMAAPDPDFGAIEVVRDTWGIPHVFSDTDEGALYGLGHATAQERGFQMTYSLRIIQGRLAEVIGERPRGPRRETSIDHDRQMRTLGWARAAARTAARLDPGTRGLLDAYCAGVNDSFAAQRKAGRLHPLFDRFQLEPEPWTPADCLLSWWHMAQFFATDGTRDLMAWRSRVQPDPGQPSAPRASPMWIDDGAAVIQRSDVTDEWVRKVDAFRQSRGLPAPASSSADGPKFSHAWVVGGSKTTTRSAVLVSDPQTPVRNPSLWIEFHLAGASFDARGIGVPGCPAFLIGFNRHVAWGLTALGADQADLFRLETDREHPHQYRWDGQWRPMDVRSERIVVRGDTNVTLAVRETHLGPVITPFCFPRPEDPEVALKRIPLCEPGRDTIQAGFAMMRARSAAEFARALADWRFPSANCVFGDQSGRIGYAVIGAIPVRSGRSLELQGGEALPGTGNADDWQGFVPAELLPQAMDPASGYFLSANHRPVGAFYGIPLGTSTGSLGDTIRSWRLRERLAAQDRFTPADVLDIHYDTVNPARRELVRLGLHLRERQPDALSAGSRRALEALDPWFESGAHSDRRRPGADVAGRISTFFRMMATPLARSHGGGESGLARFLKDASRRIQADTNAVLSAEECRYIDTVLSGAAGGAASGRGSAAAGSAPPTASAAANLGWFESLDGFGTLDMTQDLPSPRLDCVDGQTLHSQAGQSYTQWVPLHDVDSAQTLCPIGHSDQPGSRFRSSTLELWAEARLHPAPLSREAVDRIAADRLRLAP